MRPVQLHGKGWHLSTGEQREYIVGAVPDPGTATARSLLEHFGRLDEIE